MLLLVSRPLFRFWMPFPMFIAGQKRNITVWELVKGIPTVQWMIYASLIRSAVVSWLNKYLLNRDFCNVSITVESYWNWTPTGININVSCMVLAFFFYFILIGIVELHRKKRRFRPPRGRRVQTMEYIVFLKAY